MPIFRGFFSGSLAEVDCRLGHPESYILGARQVEHVRQAPVAANDAPHARISLVRRNPRQRLGAGQRAAFEAVAVSQEAELIDSKPHTVGSHGTRAASTRLKMVPGSIATSTRYGRPSLRRARHRRWRSAFESAFGDRGRPPLLRGAGVTETVTETGGVFVTLPARRFFSAANLASRIFRRSS